MGDALTFHERQDGFIEEAAVGTWQPNDLVAQMMQGRFEQLQDVVGAMDMPGLSQKLATIRASATKARSG